MKITVLGTAIVLLACIACSYAQLDLEKGLGFMKKIMSCFGKFDISSLSKLKVGGEGGGNFLKGFNTCKSKPMDEIVDCMGSQLGLNSTMLNCLQGAIKGVKM